MSADDRLAALEGKVDALTNALLKQLDSPAQAPAPEREPVPVTEADQGYDVEAENREAAEAKVRGAKGMEDANHLCSELLPLILAPRDISTLNWMLDQLNTTPAHLVQSMVKAAIVRERVNEREANGGGGASSQNIEKLAARI